MDFRYYRESSVLSRSQSHAVDWKANQPVICRSNITVKVTLCLNGMLAGSIRFLTLRTLNILIYCRGKDHTHSTQNTSEQNPYINSRRREITPSPSSDS